MATIGIPFSLQTPDPMTQESTPLPLGAILDRNGNPVRRANPDSAHLLSGASDLIRENPISMVLGALGLGIALGCLIMTARQECAEEHFITGPAEDAVEAVGATLNRLYANLQFW